MTAVPALDQKVDSHMRMSTVRSARGKFLVPVIALLALLLLTLALWYVSAFVTGPVTATDGKAETAGYTHVRSIYGSGADRLHRPTEVVADSEGNLYVADSFKHRIVVFDKNGAFVRTVGSPAKVDGALNYPSSVKVDDRGRTYVTSSNPGRVVIFDDQGKLLRAFDVIEPLTLAIKNNRLYVASTKGILIGDLDGNQVGQLLERGKEPGQIDRPTGMAVDDDGTIFLADSLNYRFQAVDSTGKVKWSLGEQPNPQTAVVDKDRSFGLPSGLTLGSDGVLYGIDAFNGEILLLSKAGEELGSYGGWGRQDGQFYYPTGITEVGSERFAIADTFNDRVQIVGIASPRPNASIVAKRGFPWLIPALAALGLVLLLRRPVAFVADAEGLRRADARGLLSELLGEARSIYVPEGTVEELGVLALEEVALRDTLVEVELGEFADDVDPAVLIGREMRGRFGLRRVTLAFPSEEQVAAAANFGLGILEPESALGGPGLPGTAS